MRGNHDHISAHVHSAGNDARVDARLRALAETLVAFGSLAEPARNGHKREATTALTS